MNKHRKVGKIWIKTIIAGLTISLAQQGLCAPTISPSALPGSVHPGVMGSQLRQEETPTVMPSNKPAPVSQEKPANALGEDAAKIQFKLTKIVLQDNHVYSEEQLLPIYKDKLNKTISILQLQDIVQNITNYYRNNGYVLTRAVIPPQHVKDGIIYIRVVEGYIDKVNVIGKPKGARKIVAAYGQNIADSKPLQLKVMEKNLLIANEIPGAQVKAVLEPSKTQTAASDLNLATELQSLNASLSYDNYGTRYVGPQQITASAGANSILRSGDATRVTYVTTPKGNSLQYRDINHDTPIGTKGLRLALDMNQAITNPLYTLKDVKIAGNAKTYNGTFRYPFIRSRERNLTAEFGFNYLDSYVTQFDTPLYTDHIRSVKAGLSYDFADRFSGANIIGAYVTQGLKILGATADNQSFFTSRYGATGRFTKVTAQINRLQRLFWRLSALGTIKGQYSFQPLLASEQFGFGGSQLGRGYDSAEIIGDRGLAGSIEIRLDTAPQKFLIQTVQYYVFYDAGEIWNMRNLQSISTKQTATSIGIGVRIGLTKYVSAGFMIAQPLTRQVQSLIPVNESKRPRAFFSLTATI